MTHAWDEIPGRRNPTALMSEAQYRHLAVLLNLAARDARARSTFAIADRFTRALEALRELENS